ncbi:MAG: XamI family restriction endonuclease [Cyanobacteriota bacterium]|nr:XamI family restriction endonuclease [Cyanobacteriota bacterium]
MSVNTDKPHLWKTDIAQSVDFYNHWFIEFAPIAYRETRLQTAQQVEFALAQTANLTQVNPTVLRQHPEILPILRMATIPPLARDRLIGLAGVTPNLVKAMEGKQRLPQRMESSRLDSQLTQIARTLLQLLDRDLFPWLSTGQTPASNEIERAATVVADRLCGAISDPIIRNAQERRQLATLQQWLEGQGYTYLPSGTGIRFESLQPGTFTFRLNIPVSLQSGSKQVNIPIDVAVMPLSSQPGDFPLLIEAKSAGDYTNTNKRRKEEAIKIAQLKSNYGNEIRFILFLCGYFDSGYLGYEAAEGIDWVWEHRPDDLTQFGLQPLES